MLGNIYKKGSKRVRIEKQISFNYFTCKEWFNGSTTTVSLTKDQVNQLEYVCTL